MTPVLAADFSAEPGPEWNRQVLPASAIAQSGQAWRFSNQPTPTGRYTNAQIDDYQHLPRRRFKWKPPLTLQVRARFSHPAGELAGTAGFGFWNDPFVMTGLRVPALPRTVWFFYASPHSDMRLALDAPGSGWKAQIVDAIRPLFFLLAPTAPLAIPLMNIPAVYRALWTMGQRALGASEAALAADMTVRNTYRLEWGIKQTTFYLNDAAVHTGPSARGPLGFVMWIDNQAMIAAPQGRFGWRAVPLEHEQWMEIDRLEIG